jgi:FHA domain
MINFVRRRFHLLEAIIFVAWGNLFAAIGVILFALPSSNRKDSALDLLALIPLAGTLLGLVFWLSWRVVHRNIIWNMQKSTFDHLFWGFCTFGVHPLFLLLLDLNAKHVVSRFYTGGKPLPLAFLKAPEAKVPTRSADTGNTLLRSGMDRPDFLRRPLSLHCVSGEFAGSDLDVDGHGIVIGRDPAQANLVLSSELISAAHVHVWADTSHTGLWVEDMGTTNGTFYCGPPGKSGGPAWIKLQGRRLLLCGARIRLAAGLAEFEVRGA